MLGSFTNLLMYSNFGSDQATKVGTLQGLHAFLHAEVAG
jgi:hypothetical protein